MSRFFIPAACLLLACHGVHASEPASAPTVDKVMLTFDWPSDMTAQVAGYQLTEKMVAGKAQPGTKMTTQYVMYTEPHGEGVKVSYRDMDVDIETDDPRMQGWVKDYTEAASEAIPSYLVAPSGEMIGVTDVTPLRDALLTSMSDLLSELEAPMREQILASIGQLYTEELLNAQIESEWNMNVGQWLGAELENDGVYSVEYETPVPALGNQMVKTQAEFEFVERVNCTEQDTKTGCARLLFRSATDDVSMKELLRRMLPAEQALPDIKIDITHYFELIAEPGTLLPYQTRLIRRTSAPEQGPEGLTSTVTTETSEYRYRY